MPTMLTPLQQQLRLGIGRTRFHQWQSEGLLPKPIRRSGRTGVGRLDYEIDAVNAARAAGASDEELRQLAKALEEQRCENWASLKQTFGLQEDAA